MEIPCFTSIKLATETKKEKVQRNPWKDELIEALVVSHIYQKEHEDNPRKALMDLLEWEQKLALDPKISKEARELKNSTPDVVFDTLRVWDALPGKVKIRIGASDVSCMLDTVSRLASMDRLLDK